MTSDMTTWGAQQQKRRWAQVVALLCVAGLLIGPLAGCAQASSATSEGNAPAACTPTDQDQYVYDPGRLQVIQGCMHVTGTVDDMWVNFDGDSIMLLRLDPPFEHLLTPGNFEGEGRGDLIIEAVCTVPTLEAAVIGLCAGDPDPVVGPYPAIGTHVWMEGRYIYDLHHEGHAELHPLYRFGVMTP